MITATATGIGADGTIGDLVDCYVLTGGHSSRFGSPKHEAILGGRTFLERVRCAAEEVFDRVWFVSREPIASLARDRQLLDEPHPVRASIFGVRRAMQHATSRFWIVAVDYPLITVDALRLLRARLEASDAQLLVPVWHDVAQMLCAGYSPELGAIVESNISSGEFRMQRLLDVSRTELIGEAYLREILEGEPFWNVNSREELEKVKQAYGD